MLAHIQELKENNKGSTGLSKEGYPKFCDRDKVAKSPRRVALELNFQRVIDWFLTSASLRPINPAGRYHKTVYTNERTSKFWVALLTQLSLTQNKPWVKLYKPPYIYIGLKNPSLIFFFHCTLRLFKIYSLLWLSCTKFIVPFHCYIVLIYSLFLIQKRHEPVH